MTYEEFANEFVKKVIAVYGYYERLEEKIANKYQQAIANGEDIDACNYCGQLQVIKECIRELNIIFNHEE